MNDWQPISTRGNAARNLAPLAALVVGLALFILWGLSV